MGASYTTLARTVSIVSHYSQELGTIVNNLIISSDYSNSKIEGTADKLTASLTNLNSKISRLKVKSLSIRTAALEAAEHFEDEAVQHLRLKHLCDNEIKKLNKAKYLVEAALLHLESAGIMVETASTIKSAATQFEAIGNSRTVSLLDTNIDKILDFKDCLDEFEECLSTGTNGDAMRDEDLLSELKALKRTNIPPSLDQTNEVISKAPVPPAHVPKRAHVNSSSSPKTLELAF